MRDHDLNAEDVNRIDQWWSRHPGQLLTGIDKKDDTELVLSYLCKCSAPQQIKTLK